MTASRQIQFTHLRALVAVAASGSLTKAAADLGYTEPAIHLQLAALRRALGGPVVARGSGRMELTELGRAVLPFAERAVAAVEDLAREAAQARASEAHVLRVGLGRGTGIYLYPRIAAVISAKLPGTSLEPMVLPGEEMVEALESNRIDLGITSNLNQMLVRCGHKPGVEFAAVPFLTYSWAFLASPGMAAAIDAGDERAVRVLLPEWAGTRQAAVAQMFVDAEFPADVQLATHTEAAKAAALASQAVAFVPQYTARHELLSGELVACLEDSFVYDASLYVGHRRPARHPDIPDFLNTLREIRGLLRQLVTVEDHLVRVQHAPSQLPPREPAVE